MTGSSFRRTNKAASAVFLFITLFLYYSSVLAQAPNGEKLFKDNCTQCHSAGENKVIGPGLKGIHERREEAWLLKWVKGSSAMIKSGDEYAVKIFNDNGKVVMPNQNLSDDEIKAVFAYVKAEGAKVPVVPVASTGAAGAEEKKGIPGMLILAVVILAILAVVLNRVKKGLEKALLIKEGKPVPERVPGKIATKRWIRGNKKLIAVILLFLFFWGSWKGWYALAGIGISQDYQPTQPIKFSHKLHAGQDKINCQYCHSGAEKSKTAGIPSANVCMNCHKYIQEGPVYGKDEIAKIYAALDYDPATTKYGNNPKPIQWTRIHNLPDLAYFNHSQHVKVGKIECQKCHGPVEEYDYDGMKQFSQLTMGWCIDCHRKTDVNTKGNAYYDKLMELHDNKAMKVEDIGGLECSKCHY